MSDLVHQSVMVNVPDPVQPPPVPLSVQLPEIEVLESVPASVSWFVPFVLPVPDWIVIWNVPVVTPPEVPARVKAPVAAAPVLKHDCEVVKLRLVTLTALPLSARVAVKPMSCVPVSVAVQFPLIALLELFPQAESAKAIKSMIAVPKCFMKSSTE